MTPLAITFMIIAMVVIWGGLVVSLVFLARHPLPPDEDSAPAGGTAGDEGTGQGAAPGRKGRRGRKADPAPGQWPGR